MESQAQFDLNDAIFRWRRNLERLPALDAGDTEELESHLRDSIATLRIRGLTLEEAFLVASQRLGPPQQLEREYGKMNPQGVWMERGLWMVVGVLYYALASAWAVVASVYSTHAFRMWSLNDHWGALVFISLNILIMAAFVVLFVRLAIRSSGQAYRGIKLCLRRPLLVILGIVALSHGTSCFPISIGKVHIMLSWLSTCEWVKMVVLISVCVYLLRARWRMLDGCSLKPEQCRVESFEPPLRKLVRVLQSDGLSQAEAILIAGRRHHQSAESIGVQKNPERRRVWMERCLWMLTGILIYCFLCPFLILSIRYTGENAEILRIWLPVISHVSVLLMASINLTVTLLIMALLWRFAIRYEALAIRLALFAMRRPFFVVLGLMLVFNGFYFLLSLLIHAAPQVPKYYRDSYYLALGWTEYGLAAFIHMVFFKAIPVLLLVWLARYRMKGQPAT